MKEEFESSEEIEKAEREQVFSKVLRAGKRTYFFDVRATKTDEYYLTITESKKRLDKSGTRMFYEKHKIYLYKEDFDRFLGEFNEVVDFVKSKQEVIAREYHSEAEPISESIDEFSSIEFEDLDK